MTDLTLFHDLHGFWLWAGLAAVLLIVEMLTGSGWLLWPAASAGVAALLVRFIGVGLEGAVLSFTVLTLATTLLARRFLPLGLLRRTDQDINDGAGRLIGQQGRVVTSFRDHMGRVFIDGKERAATDEDGPALGVGARVEVIAVNGATLTVRGA